MNTNEATTLIKELIEKTLVPVSDIVVTEGGNGSVAPGTNAIEYTADQAHVIDTIGVTTGTKGTGTSFLLPAGTYLIDFENENTSAAAEAM